MKDYIKLDEWKIIEDHYNIDHNEVSESLCSIGNGHMGQRANFEEDYSGKTLQGSYVGGVYYPDKTKVGWWKNGYPEYFAKVLNSVNWIGLNIEINGEILDLHQTAKITNFYRELDMMNGILRRSFSCEMKNGAVVEVKTQRFVSMNQVELGVISYSLSVINMDAVIHITSYLDADITNKDSNYDENFWLEIDQFSNLERMSVTTETKKTDFVVNATVFTQIEQNGTYITQPNAYGTHDKYANQSFYINTKKGEEITLEKFVVIASSLNHNPLEFEQNADSILNQAVFKGISQLENEHSAQWHKIWNDCDISISGDVAAQQGIRFNIFHLYQTYTGRDSRLNIGPKGFTGEKYGGSTYWDTEAYCIPFYMSTTSEEVARNLLVYRHNHLGKAIENATKLGFKDGAALYPMVTMNGEECHNEWEITFEEIHRNGAIAFAIYDYIRYTNDTTYIAEYGLEVLIAIARFWSQRVNFSEEKGKYVMLGVTGPNEYENNVNNNWYTNYIACWCMDYATECYNKLKETNPERLQEIAKITNFKESELDKFYKITSNMYYPENKELGIFLQQDGYMDKEQILVNDLPTADRPLNQKWSWDRILRSCFIKQADVLQGIYFFEDQFNLETLERNFHFYEQRTVHESSLSPCVHSILAAKIGDEAKSYEMYLRTSRLDLNDYNNDTEDGLHITSMAGTWLSIVKGFGGMMVKDDKLHFTTFLPTGWEGISFKVKYRGRVIAVQINKSGAEIKKESGDSLSVILNNKVVSL